MSKKLEHAVLYIRSASNSKESLNSQRLQGQNYAKQHSLQLIIIEDPHASGIGLLEKRAGLLHWTYFILNYFFKITVQS